VFTKQCDCCKELKEERSVLQLNCFRGEMEISRVDLCEDCLKELYNLYFKRKAAFGGYPLKRTCVHCGNENDYDLTCPCCLGKDWRYTLEADNAPYEKG
jgi:hypothetical protein